MIDPPGKGSSDPDFRDPAGIWNAGICGGRETLNLGIDLKTQWWQSPFSSAPPLLPGDEKMTPTDETLINDFFRQCRFQRSQNIRLEVSYLL